MLHFLPESLPVHEPGSTPEPITRLASLRTALRVVDQFGGGPASDYDVDDLCDEWNQASDAQRRCFDRRSAELVGVAASGLDVVAAHRAEGGDVSPAALQRIADEIGAGLDQLERLIRR